MSNTKGLIVAYHGGVFVELVVRAPTPLPTRHHVPTCQTSMGSNGYKFWSVVDINVQIPSAFDSFTEVKESGAPRSKEYVHIHIQKGNEKKSLKTVQGLRKEFSYEKIMKDLKKEFCCNGTVVQDK
ncbi:Protein translation factor SUI1 -like protein [Capsicum chinense]|nr:Protein translation factor SUI1 -like protein [Capsicum chinense]